MSTQPPILVTNSTCDLPAAVFRQYGITVIPMNVTFGEQTFRSGVDLTMKQFFDRLKAGENLPTTSSPSVDTFLDTYTRLAAGGTPILSIHLSDALSTTIKTANNAARQLAGQPITVWDSRTISGALDPGVSGGPCCCGGLQRRADHSPAPANPRGDQFSVLHGRSLVPRARRADRNRELLCRADAASPASRHGEQNGQHRRHLCFDQRTGAEPVKSD